MKKGKIGLAILLIIALVFGIRLISQEEGWICANGDWVEHGVPNSEKPTGYCVDGKVDNFKECIAAGNLVMGSYPRKCKNLNETFTEIIENFCTQENTEESCMNLYDPVCGYQPVQCITTPCPPISKEFSNSCFACQDEQILYYIPGECI